MSEQMDVPAANTRKKAEGKTHVHLKSPRQTTPRAKKRSGGRACVKPKLPSKQPIPITNFLSVANKECFSDCEDTDTKILRNRSLSGNLYTSSLVIETSAIAADTSLSEHVLNNSYTQVHDLSAIVRSDLANHDIVNSQTVTVKPTSKDDLNDMSGQTQRQLSADLGDNPASSNVPAVQTSQGLIMQTVKMPMCDVVTTVTQTAPMVTTAIGGVIGSRPLFSGPIYTDASMIQPHTTMGTSVMQDFWKLQAMQNPQYPRAAQTDIQSIQRQLSTIGASVNQLGLEMKSFSSATRETNDKVESIQFEQELGTSKVRHHDKKIRTR